MSPDTVKTTFTYVIALVVIVGGGVLLVVPTQLDPAVLLPFLTGVIGTVLGYVFGERTATTAATNAGTTVVAEPPSTVTVSGTPQTLDVQNHVDDPPAAVG
jgi:hypothetical protein